MSHKNKLAKARRPNWSINEIAISQPNDYAASTKKLLDGLQE
jgi:hypothetical protein